MSTQVSLTSLSSSDLSKVDILVLGAGWLSQFLLPLLSSSNFTYASTTRDGSSHYPSIPDSNLTFKYDPHAPIEDISAQFRALPRASTIVVTFPIDVPGASEKLLRGYAEVNREAEREEVGAKDEEVMWVQLGSTGVWQLEANETTRTFDRTTPISRTNARGQAEIEFLSLDLPQTSQVVLNLAGLWGGEREPRNWLGKVLPNKEALRKKGGLHMIHGEDVSQAIVLLHQSPTLLPPFSTSQPSNRRFILTDTRVYDWWDLASWWSPSPSPSSSSSSSASGAVGKEAIWVRECMTEEGVRTLPRASEKLGRVLDGRAFWEIWGGFPRKRLE